MESARVLICEDERVLAWDLKARLEQLGHAVVGVVADGKQAIEVAQSASPDLALMDIRLEGTLQGTEVASVLSEQFDIPSIFVTAYADEDTLEQAKRSEPIGYLVKPVRDSELRSAIEIGLQLHRQHIRIKRLLEEQLERINSALKASGLTPLSPKFIELLSKAEKKQALVELTRTLAHHLNNSLTAIAAPLEWLSQCRTIHEFESRFIQAAMNGCNEATHLIQKLVWATGGGMVFFEFVDVGELLNEVNERARKKVSKPSRLEMAYPGTPLRVWADRAALSQALYEVILNAYEASGGEGEVHIQLDKAKVQEATQEKERPSPPWFVKIEVKDYGSGMSSTTREAAFNPFFTTHDDPRRHGLGLSVALGVSERLGGWLELESKLGAGTSVAMYVPLCVAKQTISKREQRKLEKLKVN